MSLLAFSAKSRMPSTAAIRSFVNCGAKESPAVESRLNCVHQVPRSPALADRTPNGTALGLL